MKKYIYLILFSLFTFTNVNAQWTPEETIPVWQKRFVPPSNEVDSTFSSIMFKTEKDSFAYADIMNFRDASSTYGSTNIDTMTVVVDVVTDANPLSLVCTKMTAADVTGYPGYGATQNVIVVNPATNSAFTYLDTFTVVVEYYAYTPTGATSCDSIKTVITIGDKTSGGITSTTTTILTEDEWTLYTATLEVPLPANLTQVQYVMIVIEPKFGAINDTASISIVGAKIVNE